MSYEGYTEYICKNGHYWTIDAMDLIHGEPSRVCSVCSELPEYWHDVDQTNGYDEEYPDTCAAPRIEVGFVDVWQEDHYGNRYATKRMLYAPTLTENVWLKWEGWE